MLVEAAEPLPGWLPTRDSNPFAIATGLPLTPAVPASGTWQFDASWSIANTELQQTDGNASLLFDAETRETRFSAAYAFDPRWSLRASISHFRVGSGFLDGPVERFHRAFGFDNGDRGQLGTQAPQIEVRDDGELLYVLNDARSDSGPLLADLTRSWDFGDRRMAGLTLGAKFPTGSHQRLSDSDSTDISLSTFVLMAIGERFTIGGRSGVLVQGDNRLLDDYARDAVPFANALVRYRLGQKWSAVLQSVAHGAL
jgi:hypothetical protein